MKNMVNDNRLLFLGGRLFISLSATQLLHLSINVVHRQTTTTLFATLSVGTKTYFL